MPTPLGEIHHELHEEVSWLHLKWNQFRALYASTDETIDLLNATAPTFFKNQCRIMWEDALLHLCRVTDRPKSCGKPTLTIMRIPTLIPDDNIRTQVRSWPILPTRSASCANGETARWHTQRVPPLDGQPGLYYRRSPTRASKTLWRQFARSSVSLSVSMGYQRSPTNTRLKHPAA